MNRDRCIGAVKIRHQMNKRIVVDRYGGRCKCCGEADIRFLTVDHINNDGAEHRKEISIGCGKGGGSTTFYRWIIRNNFPDSLQILCWNCNLSKYHFGLCPHQIQTPLIQQ